ncbi:MAG: pseudouridine synthase [Flavobacteriales bacterium]|nr:pseudouridine synthase [Flavobacteriales bacterium]MCB9365073.1 pseudouridine synthase [Flavobacteriales bacterium]
MVIEILYEDEFIVVVNKPNDVLMYPSYYARNIKDATLVELLNKQLQVKTSPLHRLDRKTSGVVIFGKSAEVAKVFEKLFAQHQIEKTYLAIVRGFCENEGVIGTPIKNNDTGVYKDALTTYKTITTYEWEMPVTPYDKSRYSLIELAPKTGRMHQLRKHLNKINHPIIGDHKYGDRNYNKTFTHEFGFDKLLLHAKQLNFTHPLTNKEMEINASIPDNWNAVLKTFNWKV